VGTIEDEGDAGEQARGIVRLDLTPENAERWGCFLNFRRIATFRMAHVEREDEIASAVRFLGTRCDEPGYRG
jgi:hypothetical protein